MVPGQPSTLQMPAFLHGSFMTVARKTSKEGRHCVEQYHRDGSFPVPRELVEVPPGEVVITHEVADFQRERPAWRLYLLSRVMAGLYEAMNVQDIFRVRDAYEEFCREMAWGALYFAVAPTGPESAERTALRLQAVLRFWEPLQSVRYLFRTFNAVLTLDGLMAASCDWALDAWCPVGEASVRVRLEKAAERMARATKEECMEAILRQMPQALAASRGLRHRSVLADQAFLRERLAALEPAYFDRVSGARTANLLELLYDWDHQLTVQ